jgi:hypothetical protein
VLRFPETSSSLVIRTDYSDQAVWQGVRRRIEATNEDGFRAHVGYWDDPPLAGQNVGELMDLVKNGAFRTFFFVVDRETIENAEHPVLVVDLSHEPGRTFRVVPGEMWGVENNLSISNMDFSEFADNADPDGNFRGFS